MEDKIFENEELVNKMTAFTNVCKMSQVALKIRLEEWLLKHYDEVIYEDGFLYAKGKDPILLTAHMDTVHKSQCSQIYYSIQNDGCIRLFADEGIGGDDRCGIYMIMRIIEETDMRPSILFCEDEEIGGVGSRKFVKTKFLDDLLDVLFLIELDRANARDVVFYDDDNEKFHEFCIKATGYKESWGTFSDISILSPECMISSVNVSCGYYGAHTTDEYVVWNEMEDSIEAVKKLMAAGLERNEQFEYVETVKCGWGYGNSYRSLYSKYFEDDLDGGEIERVVFYDDQGLYYEIVADTFDEAVGRLMQDYPLLCWNDVIDYDIFTKD